MRESRGLGPVELVFEQEQPGRGERQRRQRERGGKEGGREVKQSTREMCGSGVSPSLNMINSSAPEPPTTKWEVG